MFLGSKASCLRISGLGVWGLGLLRRRDEGVAAWATRTCIVGS